MLWTFLISPQDEYEKSASHSCHFTLCKRATNNPWTGYGAILDVAVIRKKSDPVGDKTPVFLSSLTYLVAENSIKIIWHYTELLETTT
jgi:hypothetical protein